MEPTKSEQEMRQEFVEFIDTEQIVPDKHLDEAILTRVTSDLQPSLWKIYGKFTLIETTAGLVTLAICPQFGLGVGQHNQFLHDLHSSIQPVFFYLFCGLFFVVLGASVGGLVLNRSEIQAAGKSKYLYFVIYSILAYLVLMMLGAEAFVISSLVWVLGALLGNILGFEAVARLRLRAVEK